MKFLVNENIAHRGLYNNNEKVPENSIIAFKKAIENNIPIELDVQITNDGKLIIFHDFNLLRMTGINKNVIDCSLEQIQKLNLLNTKYKIPTLIDTLKIIDNKVPILIEIKDNSLSKKLERHILKILRQYKGRYAIESFNPFVILWLRIHANEIYRGQLSSHFEDDKMPKLQKYLLKNMFMNFLTSPHFISYNIKNLPDKRVEKLRKKGKYIFGWTIDSKEEYEKSKKYCDSIIFENLNIKNSKY